jgi:hypothetical protein
LEEYDESTANVEVYEKRVEKFDVYLTYVVRSPMGTGPLGGEIPHISGHS